MKKHFSTIFLMLILLIGLSLVLYPSFANWWNSFHQSRAIAQYDADLAKQSPENLSAHFDSARLYNQQLRQVAFPLKHYDEVEGYFELLDISGNGIMGYIEIPKIDVRLPIYHGDSEGVLQVAVGHIQGTSLPTGGTSTHCVLSGHRGLPSAKLFTDLDEMDEGDIFTICVLTETLTYEVDQIKVVNPDDVQDLNIQDGKDLVTLVTCTPYGINSHRLLVRGHRIENTEATVSARVTGDALLLEPLLIAVIVFVPILIILISATLIIEKSGRKK